jgi:ABC-2 type transport system ATP-binding protein
MEEADKLCDVVAFMHLGHLVAIDTPEKLKAGLRPNAKLDDVFIQLTGESFSGGGDFRHAKETRKTLSRLE